MTRSRNMNYKVRLLTTSEKVIPFSVMKSLSDKLKLTSGTEQLWERIEIFGPGDTLLSTLERALVEPESGGETTLKELGRKIQDKYPVNARQWLKNYFTTVKAIYTFNIFPDRMNKNTWLILGGIQNFLKDSLNGYHVDLTANIPLEMEGNKPGAYDMVFRSSGCLINGEFTYIE